MKMNIHALRPVYNLAAIVVVLSLLLQPVAAVPFLAETPPSPSQNNPLDDKEPLYRTRVTLHQPADGQRLDTLVTQILESGDDWALAIVNQAQLADLARLRFEPGETDSLGRLGFGAESLVESRLLQAIIEAPMADVDGDGLSDTEEEWWCTDPFDNNSDSPLPPSQTNPSDGDEVAAILSGITAYGPPFALWPQFTPYNPDGTCPDGDFDAVPDFAEEFIIGTSQLRESSDKDKFDDGQELFGVTFCPAGSGPCGYGILPRAEDSAWVSANLPAWVLPPGNSPWVAAFPFPEVEVVPSSINMVAVTTITTDRTITEGEEHTYGSSTTNGTSESEANSKTWNEWEERYETSPVGPGETIIIPPGLANCPLPNQRIQFGCEQTTTQINFGDVRNRVQGGINWISDKFSLVKEQAVDISNNLSDWMYQNVSKCEIGIIPLGLNCDVMFRDRLTSDPEWLHIQSQILSGSSTDQVRDFDGSTFRRGNGNLADHILTYPMVYPAPQLPTTTIGGGQSQGGSHTITHTQYEEQTISEATTNQFSESWSNATAVDTAHAADLRFTYNIVNNGTEYAREVTSLLFNIYIGNDLNPAYSYVAVGDTGQIAQIENLFPGESLTFTSSPIPLNLDEMQAIDGGASIRIVMEDIAFGQDQVFYQDALNGSVMVSMEDGFDDGDEVIDTYLIAVWNPSDTVQDVLKRYFPVTEDADGNLLSIATPEFETNPPVFHEHALTGTSWWNIYMSEGLEYAGVFSSTLAAPNTTVLVRILSDRDLDGYNDRNEIRLGTDPDDPTSHPNPELLAGYTTECFGDDCTVLMTFLNTGNYDAFSIKTMMYTPDGLTEITDSIIGGSGRVPAGAQVVLGNRILQPDLTGWTGGAQPYSTGYYLGDTDRTYTITAQTSGNIGSGSLNFNWTDGTNSGTVSFGSGYQAPLPLPIAEGVEIGFQTGSVNGGEQFVVRALTPRDTFQYTINDPEAAEPVIVVSYNDPQGNHRFILPSASLLTDLNSDLTFLSGQMIPDPGVDIASTSPTQANFILNAPHGTPITDGHLFVEYIDLEGNVDREDVFTQTLQTGPTVIPVVVDTNVFTPTEYTLLAFFTDSQGNIIDSSARPLASFGPDPLPEAHLSAGQWLSGTTAGPTLPAFPNPWSVGTVVSGTLLTAQLTLANTGLGNLRYALTGLNNGLAADSTTAGTLSPANIRAFTLTLDTANFPAGPFTRTLTLRTSDPNQANVAIPISGTIVSPNGEATVHPVSPYQPWNEYVFVPGPHNFNEVITFTHTITSPSNQIQPLYVYAEQGATLLGVGEYGFDTSGQTLAGAMFGDGRNGDLTVTSGNTVVANTDNTWLIENIHAGESILPVANTTGFNQGDKVLIIQMNGPSAGQFEIQTVSDTGVNVITLTQEISNNYIVMGSATLYRDPNYSGVSQTFTGSDECLNNDPIGENTVSSLTVVPDTTIVVYEYCNFEGVSEAFTSDDPNLSGNSIGNETVSSLRIFGGVAQVIRVPQFRNVTVQSGGTLTANNWNGNSGGIVAFLANGDVSINGAITTNGAGFRGGPRGSAFGININGQQGESYYGTGVIGEPPNLGGGGGGSFIPNDWGAGGGGGGYGTNGMEGGGENNRGGNPGQVYGTADLDQIYLGSGGGGGGVGDAVNGGGNGSRGGGIIIVNIKNLSVAGGITSNGANGIAGGLDQGGGGGGSGGTIKLTLRSGSVGNNLVTANGGTGGPGNGSRPGGNGGYGRIHISHCEPITGATNPLAQYADISCYIIRQLPGSPNIELTLPEDIIDGGNARYMIQFGQRSANTTGGNQLFSVQLPKRVYENVTLDVLLENLGVSSSSIALDIGNDGTADWTVSATTQPISHTSPNLAVPLNAYLASQTPEPDGTVLVPIRVNLNTTGDIFLFNLAATPAADADVQPTALTISPLGGAPADNIAEGTPVTLTAVISNTGSHAAENFVVAFYNGDPDEGGTLIDSTFIPTLAAGAASPVQSVVWDTTGLLGPQTIVVVADASAALAESNESNNNQSAAAIVRKKPDLMPLTLTIPEVRVDEAVTVTAVITNDGEADVTGIPVTLYAGTPLTGTAVATDTVDVSAFSAVTASWSWTPSQVGPQLLSVAADPGDHLVEADETNNALSQTAVVGWDSLTVDAGGTVDPAYSAALGYGRLTEGTAVTGCGNDPEQTYRQGSSTETIDYRFDNLLPGRRYHLDLTFALCSGERWVNLFVDGRPMADTTALPGVIEPVQITTNLQTVSLLLEPVDYADGTVTLSIQRADGFGGPIVNLIDLQEIRYCYRDSGPAEEAWTAVNGCGYDATWPSDGFNGWGNSPEQTVRFSENGQIRYRLTGLETAVSYNVRLTFYEGDGVGRQQRILFDSTVGETVTLGPTASYSLQQLPLTAYTDGDVLLAVERLNPMGDTAVISELVLEEITRRYPFAPGGPTSTPTNTPTPSPTPTDTPTPTNTPVPPTPTDTPVPPTPTDTPIPPTPTPPPNDLIFADGFESGDMSAWSSNVNDGGDLSVNPTAALVGSFGLQANINDNNSMYVQDDTPVSEPRYRARFYFDPNSIAMATGNNHFIFSGRGAGTESFRLMLSYSAGSYQLLMQIRNDAGSFISSSTHIIADTLHFIEIDWRAATAPGANDGYMTLWVDDVLLQTQSGIDNDTRRVDEARLGPLNGIDTGTRGIYLIDAFESRRSTYIGPAAIPVFHASPISGDAPLEVTFVNTTQREAQITGYLWEFGDGTTSTEENPTHRYEVAGRYTVSLTVFNATGHTTETLEDYIIIQGQVFLPFVQR
ncbi:MAG: PKD domain-containing protein [Anaerolineae bacterium]|nr:PKD domain-containing protein [Anaerolineae bacterium]